MRHQPQIYKRRVIRERVMQALYALEISQDPIEHVIDTVLHDLQQNEEEIRFARQLLLTTLEHQSSLDEWIKKKAANWDFHRIALIDRLLLRMGIAEFLFFEDIPPKVSINEAIEIAKRFSTPKSGQFINGILDSILHDLRAQGMLEKRGRGLLENAKKGKPDSTENEV